MFQVDIGDLPPLFCRPRRSPKLNCDSRQASLLGGFCAGSRQITTLSRLNTEDTLSQFDNSSPALARNLRIGKLDKNHIIMIDSSSKTTIDNPTIREEKQIRAANIKLALDDYYIELSPEKNKNKRILSTIASSSTTSDYPSQIIRESRSLDPFPLYNNNDSPNLKYRLSKKSFKSLENCSKYYKNYDNNCNKIVSNHYSNGNTLQCNNDFDDNLVDNDVDEPLLSDSYHCINDTLDLSKSTQSLDHVLPEQCNDNVQDKKTSARNSIKSWIVNFISGNNGIRSSDVSLRNGGVIGYDIQSERESIV